MTVGSNWIILGVILDDGSPFVRYIYELTKGIIEVGEIATSLFV